MELGNTAVSSPQHAPGRKGRDLPESKGLFCSPKKWKIPEHCVYSEQLTEKYNGSPGQCQGSWNPPLLSQKGKDGKQQEADWQESTAIFLLSQHSMGQGTSFFRVSMHSVHEFMSSGVLVSYLFSVSEFKKF